MQIRTKQIRIIKMAVRQLGMDDDTYRAMLHQAYGVDSCTLLTIDQADALIDRLQGQGFAFKPSRKRESAIKRWSHGQWGGGKQRPVGSPRKESGKVVSLASVAEIEKINAIAAHIAWRYENGLALFLAKRMGIKGGKVRTADEAYRAIEGLKKMFIHAMEANNGPDWWMLHYDPPVEQFIAEHAPSKFRCPVTGRVYKQPVADPAEAAQA